MAEKEEYFVRVRGTSVPVTQEVYQVCHQTKRYAKTLYEKDARHNLVSYDGMDTEDTLGAETISDPDAPSVEDVVLNRLLKEKLRHCLTKLPKAERDLIYALYFDGHSERQVASRLGIHYMTLHCRKASILQKLRKMIEN